MGLLPMKTTTFNKPFLVLFAAALFLAGCNEEQSNETKPNVTVDATKQPADFISDPLQNTDIKESGEKPFPLPSDQGADQFDEGDSGLLLAAKESQYKTFLSHLERVGNKQAATSLLLNLSNTVGPMLQRAAQEGQVDFFNALRRIINLPDAFKNHGQYYSKSEGPKWETLFGSIPSSVWETCFLKQRQTFEISDQSFETIDFEALIIVQNYCDVVVQAKDQKKLYFFGQKAEEVRHALLTKKYGKDHPLVVNDKPSQLEIYLDTGHGFVGFKSSDESLFENRPVKNGDVFGFYPKGELFWDDQLARFKLNFVNYVTQRGVFRPEPKGYIQEYRERSGLKLTVLLGNAQMEKVLNHAEDLAVSKCTNEDKKLCHYNVRYKHCLSTVNDLFTIAGGSTSIYSYFTLAQLQNGRFELILLDPAKWYDYKAFSYATWDSVGTVEVLKIIAKKINNTLFFRGVVVPFYYLNRYLPRIQKKQDMEPSPEEATTSV